MITGKSLAGLFLLVISLIGPGCKTPQENTVRVPPGVAPSDIAAVHIISVPVGLNLDGRPGLDGISLKVYANDWKNPKPIPIQSGSLEIQMFDGRFTTNSSPLKVWTYPADKLKPFRFEARLGTGYQFTLLWEDSRPSSRAVTVRAKYTSPSGLVLRSSPSAITVEDMPAR